MSDEQKANIAALKAAKVVINGLTRQNSELQAHNNKLLFRSRDAEMEAGNLATVADCAARICIDLDYNLGEANREYLSGKIPHGAFLHVLNRHTNLHAALRRAGYSENCKLFGFPAKPKHSPQPQEG